MREAVYAYANRLADEGRLTRRCTMLARLQILWSHVRDSLWFLPAVLTTAAVLLAFVVVTFDASYEIPIPDGNHWLVGGSVEGARAVLSTIAGSLITVTGVIFSVTIVALQLASSQFTPRILRNFMGDRTNQLVLAVFIATFTYTLLVLRVVRSVEEGQPFVPKVSVALAIVFCLISIGVLIHFIHHTARSIQAVVILAKIAAVGVEQVRRLFPVEIGERDEQPPLFQKSLTAPPRAVRADRTGYLQAVDGQTLFHLGERQELLIEMAQPIGTFILQGQPLALVWAERECGDDAERAIRNAFLLGQERTPDQDLEYVLLEISDIAVKALSPGINDPTTAMLCIDRLAEILLLLGNRRPPLPLRTAAGHVHFLTRPTTFARALDVAFQTILHYGRDNPEILGRVQATVKTLKALLPVEHHASLERLARRHSQILGFSENSGG